MKVYRSVFSDDLGKYTELVECIFDNHDDPEYIGIEDVQVHLKLSKKLSKEDEDYQEEADTAKALLKLLRKRKVKFILWRARESKDEY